MFLFSPKRSLLPVLVNYLMFLSSLLRPGIEAVEVSHKRVTHVSLDVHFIPSSQKYNSEYLHMEDIISPCLFRVTPLCGMLNSRGEDRVGN